MMTKTAKSPRERYLLKTYGITEKQYKNLLKRQKNCCAVCLKPASEERKNLCVDHNHRTGEIRGLLCYLCNHRVIGRHTDHKLLLSASVYLQQGTGWFVPSKKKRKKK